MQWVVRSAFIDRTSDDIGSLAGPTGRSPPVLWG